MGLLFPYAFPKSFQTISKAVSYVFLGCVS